MKVDANNHIYDGVYTKHKVYDEHYGKIGYTNFILEKDESFGTFRLVGMARYIIEMFYKAPSSAQLVINTHNTSLLNSKDENKKNLLRKDQIYITNKNRYGESTLMPVTEYRDKLLSNIEKNYLDGNLTGVPSVDTDYLKTYSYERKQPFESAN